MADVVNKRVELIKRRRFGAHKAHLYCLVLGKHPIQKQQPIIAPIKLYKQATKPFRKLSLPM